MAQSSLTKSLCPDHLPMLTPADHRLAGYSVRGADCANPGSNRAVLMVGDRRERFCGSGSVGPKEMEAGRSGAGRDQGARLLP